MIKSLEKKILINGKLVLSSGREIKVVNPATLEIIGKVADATIKEVDQSVISAREAFIGWKSLSGKERGDYLHTLGNLIGKDLQKMAMVMSMEQGKPIDEAKGEISKLVETCHFYAEEAGRIHGRIIDNDKGDCYSQVIREPIGVVAAITPWNYPAELIGWKLCGALAAGCTIVIKPAELTPFTGLMIAEKVIDADIPKGVVNLVTGSGEHTGQVLIEHKDIDKIAFTGSGRVGLHIQKSCCNIKRLSLELGGNCPLIVTENADIDSAVQGAVRRSFRNGGQICIAINRIYVAKRKMPLFLDRMVTATKALIVANGCKQADADLGALACRQTLEKTQEHIQDALKKGAKLITGGTTPPGKEFEKGFFFLPTILSNCHQSMKIMREETFGPVVGVTGYNHLADALRWANDTPYGLAAYVYSRDADEIYGLSRNLDYGNVAVNNVDAGTINAPYGGRKQSGFGYEHGREGMLEYTQIKHIRLRHHPLKEIDR